MVRAVEQIPAEQLTHDFQTADRTILSTLAHVYAADRVWLRRILGEPVTGFISEEDHRLCVLQQDWPVILSRWQEWARTLKDPTALVQFIDRTGNPFRSQTWEIVLHVVNHGTHHRGQVAGFLRTLGHTPPPLDLIRYYRGL